jgi:hypothetical protein
MSRYRTDRTCPLDNKMCKVYVTNEDDGYDDNWANPHRSCRHGFWNSNVDQPKCKKEIFRKRKTSKPFKRCRCK